MTLKDEKGVLCEEMRTLTSLLRAIKYVHRLLTATLLVPLESFYINLEESNKNFSN